MPGNRAVIIIVSYGRPGDIARCLSALAKSTDRDFEAVVVENAGADAYRHLVEHLTGSGIAVRAGAGPAAAASVRGDAAVAGSDTLAIAGDGQPLVLIEAKDNLGYGGGINVALRALRRRPGWNAVWVLNPDTVPSAGALEAVRKHADAGGYGLVGSRLVFRDTAKVQMRGGLWRRFIARGLGLGIGEDEERPVEVRPLEAKLEWISGAAMYVTRAFVETVGELDDSYFLYCEDVDWAFRRGSFKLGYAHESVVYHEHGTTIGSSVNNARRSGLSIYLMERNRLLLTRRHYPQIYPMVAAICLVGLGQSYALRGNWRGLATGLNGWWAGVRGETGRPAF